MLGQVTCRNLVSTCWRRLRDWNGAGVWQRLHEVLLGKLRAAGQLDMSRAAIDGSHVRALDIVRRRSDVRSSDLPPS